MRQLKHRVSDAVDELDSFLSCCFLALKKGSTYVKLLALLLLVVMRLFSLLLLLFVLVLVVLEVLFGEADVELVAVFVK